MKIQIAPGEVLMVEVVAPSRHVASLHVADFSTDTPCHTELFAGTITITADSAIPSKTVLKLKGFPKPTMD